MNVIACIVLEHDVTQKPIPLIRRTSESDGTVLLVRGVAFIRGTTADVNGNTSMEHEATVGEDPSIAPVVHNAGGAEDLSGQAAGLRRQSRSRLVKIPGF